MFNPGEIVEGRYKIIRPLAAGGMGTVFLAEHWLIKRKVAMKVLHADLVDDATIIRRFMNEALAAGTLGHPNIVESTDMGFANGTIPYIVFEYLEGTGLAEELARVRAMPVTRALKIAHQIAGALEAAHAAGIVHRDLKTDNVFLARRAGVPDLVKVLDFGISRFVTAGDRTHTGANLLGTPEYMAPEQVLTPETIDRRVDIYALGIVLYELLTGGLPFSIERRPVIASFDDTEALLDRICNDKPPPIQRAGVPRELAVLVEDKLLAKVPKWRPQTMRDVQVELEAIAQQTAEPLVPTPRASRIARLSDQSATRTKITADELAREVKALGSRWSLVDNELQCELEHPEMARLAGAVGAAAAIADELEQHPRIELSPPRLRIAIANARTVGDLIFAARVEAWLRDNGW